MSSKFEIKKINTPLRVREFITIEAGGKKYVFEGNSPTNFFIQDVVGEATVKIPEAAVHPIEYLSVCDSNNNYCMNITGDKLKREPTSSTSIRVSGTETWNSSTRPAIVELGWLISDKAKIPYFSTPLPGSINVQQGTPLSVIWDASFSLQVTSASGFLSGSKLDASSWLTRLCMILIGARPPNKLLTLTKCSGFGRAGRFWLTNVVRDTKASKVGIYNVQVETSGDLSEVWFGDDDFSAAIVFTLSTPLKVKAGDYVTIELSFQTS